MKVIGSADRIGNVEMRELTEVGLGCKHLPRHSPTHTEPVTEIQRPHREPATGAGANELSKKGLDPIAALDWQTGTKPNPSSVNTVEDSTGKS